MDLLVLKNSLVIEVRLFIIPEDIIGYVVRHSGETAFVLANC